MPDDTGWITYTTEPSSRGTSGYQLDNYSTPPPQYTWTEDELTSFPSYGPPPISEREAELGIRGRIYNKPVEVVHYGYSNS